MPCVVYKTNLSAASYGVSILNLKIAIDISSSTRRPGVWLVPLCSCQSFPSRLSNYAVPVTDAEARSVRQKVGSLLKKEPVDLEFRKSKPSTVIFKFDLLKAIICELCSNKSVGLN